MDPDDFFNQIPGMFAVVDLQFNFIKMTDLYLVNTFTKRSHLIGKNLFDIFPDNVDKEVHGSKPLRDLLNKVIETKTEQKMDVIRYDTIDRFGNFKDKYWLTSIHPLLKNGELVYLYIKNEEVTELLKHKNELERMKDDVSKEKFRFLGNFSHEINTPMTSILHSLQVLEKKGIKEPQIVSLGRQTQRLQFMFEDVFDFIKMDTFPIQINKENFDLQESIEQVWDLSKDMLESKNLVFDKEMNFDKLRRFGDRHHLQRIMYNLLENAIKFSKPDTAISASYWTKDDVFFHCIRDYGSGISKEELVHLYEPFYQADKSKHHVHGGLGISLILAKRILEFMKGEFIVESEKGKGTTITMKVPLPFIEETDEELLYHKKCAVVDDNMLNRKIVAKLLSRYKIETLDFPDGIDIVKHCQNNGHLGFDWIIMDIQMPGLDGIEATKEIRKLNPNIPILGLSANTIDSYQASIDAGMQDFMTKPVTANTLKEKLVRYMIPFEQS